MIVEAFLRWSDTASVNDRASAASALARSYLDGLLPEKQSNAAFMAMTCLLDDPSPRVRVALATELAKSEFAPRSLILALSEDQPEVSANIILLSSLLKDGDLIEIAASNCSVKRSIIAMRPNLSLGVCAALAEIGDAPELLLLLDNSSAELTAFTLRRISERMGGNCDIRDALLSHSDLPIDVRYSLVEHIGAALAQSDFINNIMTSSKAKQVVREASDSATITLAGEASANEITRMVQHVHKRNELTPALLIHSLCSGKLEFFTASIAVLSGLEVNKVRAILSSGRIVALKSLLQSIGLDKNTLNVFVEAVELWRKAANNAHIASVTKISNDLLSKYEHLRHDDTMSELIHVIEKLDMSDQRQKARTYMAGVMIEAA